MWIRFCDFPVKLRPEVNQFDAQDVGDLAVDAQGCAAALNGLRHGLFGVMNVVGQRSQRVTLLDHDHFSVDYVLIIVYHASLNLCVGVFMKADGKAVSLSALHFIVTVVWAMLLPPAVFWFVERDTK